MWQVVKARLDQPSFRVRRSTSKIKAVGHTPVPIHAHTSLLVPMNKPNLASTRRDESQKRKRPSTADRTPSSATKQQTLQALFSTTQQQVPRVTKAIDPTSDSVPQKQVTTASPNSKRLKLANAAVVSCPAASDTLCESSMYSFPSRQRQSTSNNAIDLTASPSGSPSSRRPQKTLPTATFNPRTGAKKIVVKNLRDKPRASDPRAYLNTTWDKLDRSLNAISTGEKVPFSLEELYRGVENVCRQGFAEELCARLEGKSRGFAEEWVNGEVLGVNGQDVHMLGKVVEAWAVWGRQMVCCY
jgi:cullin-4